jgi:hypothetical protein
MSRVDWAKGKEVNLAVDNHTDMAIINLTEVG